MSMAAARVSVEVLTPAKRPTAQEELRPKSFEAAKDRENVDRRVTKIGRKYCFTSPVLKL